MAVTENKLKNATKDLKNIGDSAMTEKEEQKQNIRQKMTRKMRTVHNIVFMVLVNWPELNFSQWKKL